MNLSRDGVSLAYSAAGQGDPPLVFIHGWACNRSFFAPQLAQFAREHQVLSVDLRGHGQSDAPDQAYPMSVFADDTRWLWLQLGLSRPVIVGHSMGSLVALQLAAQRPTDVRGIVMLDGPTHPLVGAPPNRSSLIDELHRDGWQDATTVVIEQMFLPSDDRDRAADITRQMLATPRHVIAGALAGARAFDLVAALQACDVPALYVQAGQPKPGLERMPDYCPQVVIDHTPDVGHFHQLEAPEQINAAIERFVGQVTCAVTR